jgi:putative ABC transport system permease protein
MKALRRFFVRLGGWIGLPRRNAELDREIGSLLQMHIDENLKAGMTPEEANRQAALAIGGVQSVKEGVREMWTLRWLDSTVQDLKYAVRGLWRSPGFSAAAVLSLALGLGGSIAIFTVVDNLLLRPLPYRDPGGLVMLWENNIRRSALFNVISPANYLNWKAQSDVFETMSAFLTVRSVLSDGSRVEELGRQAMTADLLPSLGVQPIRGRLFTADEDKPGRDSVLLISYRLWQNWFGGDENIVGRKVQIDSTSREIIGVMPPGFYFRDRDVDMWAPLGLDPSRDYFRTAGRYLLACGRLKPGVKAVQAQSQLDVVAKRLEAANPEFDKNWGVTVEPLRDSLVRDVKPSLLILLGAVGLLLAVACSNVANLLLARCVSRRREIAVRASLGAGRWRVIRQLITESMVVGLAGGLIGLLLARWEVLGLLELAPKDMTRSAGIQIDLRVILGAFALSLLTGIIFGLAPALVASRGKLAGAMQKDSRSSIGGGGRLRDWLVGAEVALSIVLLAGAGLLFRSFVRLQSVDPGLDASHMLTFQVSIPAARYPEVHKRTQFYQRLLEEIERLPGVRSASAVSYLPFNGLASGTWVGIGGRPPAKPGEELSGTIRTVMPGYFRTMGIPIRSGRDFTEADNLEKAPFRFIVNETFVRKYLPGEQPLGKTVNADMDNVNPFGEIIGVVGDVREGSLDQEPSPTVYYPLEHLSYASMVVVARTEGDPSAIAEASRRIVLDIDPAQPISNVRTMQAVLGETMARNRFSMVLLAAFSVCALMLAAVGIYGVLAYSVSERTREIGIRVALGANPVTISLMVLKAGGRMVLIGMAAGLAGALASAGVLSKLLYSVPPRDPFTFVIAPVVLTTVALLAAYVPARRAAKLEPMAALRTE